MANALWRALAWSLALGTATEAKFVRPRNFCTRLHVGAVGRSNMVLADSWRAVSLSWGRPTVMSLEDQSSPMNSQSWVGAMSDLAQLTSHPSC